MKNIVVYLRGVAWVGPWKIIFLTIGAPTSKMPFSQIPNHLEKLALNPRYLSLQIRLGLTLNINHSVPPFPYLALDIEDICPIWFKK